MLVDDNLTPRLMSTLIQACGRGFSLEWTIS
jgi:hypothetical protein